jgi:polyisoprenoid-binding protein YceI
MKGGIAAWTIVLAASLAASAHAAGGRVGRLALDPHHTVVAFHVGTRLHDVRGTFALTEGTLAVDRDTGATEGSVVVDAGSGESANASRDRRMADLVLEADRFPEIRFRGLRVDGAERPDGSFAGTLHGVLTLHGGDHEVAVAVEGRRDGDDHVSAHARFTVPYVAWGLADPSLLLLTVDPVVDVDVTTTGLVVWSTTADAQPRNGDPR